MRSVLGSGWWQSRAMLTSCGSSSDNSTPGAEAADPFRSTRRRQPQRRSIANALSTCMGPAYVAQLKGQDCTANLTNQITNQTFAGSRTPRPRERGLPRRQGAGMPRCDEAEGCALFSSRTPQAARCHRGQEAAGRRLQLQLRVQRRQLLQGVGDLSGQVLDAGSGRCRVRGQRLVHVGHDLQRRKVRDAGPVPVLPAAPAREPCDPTLECVGPDEAAPPGRASPGTTSSLPASGDTCTPLPSRIANLVCRASSTAFPGDAGVQVRGSGRCRCSLQDRRSGHVSDQSVLQRTEHQPKEGRRHVYRRPHGRGSRAANGIQGTPAICAPGCIATRPTTA